MIDAASRSRLGVRQATSMAIGGMIGGGIFAVPGIVIDLAGVFTIAVYAFTFGHYLANALELPDLAARLVGLATIAIVVFANPRGEWTSGIVEDLVVVKLVVLGVIAAIGLSSFGGERFSPVANEGVLGLFDGAALIFMAYEGFPLGAAAAAFSLMPGITQIVAFGSFTFLGVFALVNQLHAHQTARGAREAALGYTAAGGSIAAGIVLLVYLAGNDVTALAVIAACVVILVSARQLFHRHRRNSFPA